MTGALASGRRRAPIVGINVTPMVDVVLVLLVIMMVSATYIVAQSLKVDLPNSPSSSDAVPLEAQVTVKKDGSLLYGEKPVSEADLVGNLREAFRKDPEMSVVITGDRAAAHGDIVRVVGLAKLEDITKFAIQVEPKP
ncbi:MAG: biopolymer transporter ExbD [Polyangiaceae bacterium]|nr:biopolymer transporter ExbD [Polyangiaceae bacterium]